MDTLHPPSLTASAASACNPRDFTDIWIKWSLRDGAVVVNEAASLVYWKTKPGEGVAPPAETYPLLHELAAASEAVASVKQDFLVNHVPTGTFFRGVLLNKAVDGTWYRLRVLKDAPPRLENLGSPMPDVYVQQLMDPALCRGGLIAVLGKAGSGKSHTSSAILVSRLHAFGGSATTLEDPPEFPLNGKHGDGYCTQTSVAGDDGRDWKESMRTALRSQPVGAHLIMYVGELRDAESAQMAMRAATNGFLVICTSFASDIISGLDAILNLVGHEHADTFAHVLRVAVYQVFDNERLAVTTLVSDGPNSTVGVLLRSGNLQQLQDEIRYQKNQILQAERKTARPLAAVA